MKNEQSLMSEAGMTWFISIADKLSLSEKEQGKLLGARKKEILITWKNNPDLIPPETITRLSYLIGIYKDLNILFKPDTVLEWLRNENSNQLFNGLSPLKYIMENGLDHLLNVRVYLSNIVNMDEAVEQRSIVGHFRPSAERLNTITKKSAEFLEQATEEELMGFVELSDSVKK